MGLGRSVTGTGAALVGKGEVASALGPSFLHLWCGTDAAPQPRPRQQFDGSLVECIIQHSYMVTLLPLTLSACPAYFKHGIYCWRVP